MPLLPHQTTIDPKSIQILIAEDDDSQRNLLARTLQMEGYGVTLARNGCEALDVFDIHAIDCVVLALPDSLTICSELRQQSYVPIIMLSANTHTDDVIIGIELGADHYMTKPFDLHELRARMHATLWRACPQPPPNAEPLIAFGDIVLNKTLQRVTVRGEVTSLTPNEYRMLSYLMHNPDKPVSNAELLRAVWNYRFHEDSNIVRVTMWRLRSKIEEKPANPRYLKTVSRLGYQFSTTAGDKAPKHNIIQLPMRKAG